MAFFLSEAAGSTGYRHLDAEQVSQQNRLQQVGHGVGAVLDGAVRGEDERSALFDELADLLGELVIHQIRWGPKIIL